jgi:hypothetical protein
VARPDALREIVARQERWRVRTLAGALAAVLLGGPIAGYALAQTGASAGTAVAAQSKGAPAASPNAPAPAIATSGSSSGGFSSTGVANPATPPRQLFIRTTSDGVRIRGYLQSFPNVTVYNCGAIAPMKGGATTGAPGAPATPPPPAESNGASTGHSTNAVPPVAAIPACPQPATAPTTCKPNDALEAQVSNDQVAGATGGMPVSAASTQALSVLAADVVGAGDPTPIGTVLLHTGTGVASVRLRVTGGSTDVMKPVDGYAILAAAVTGLTPTSPAVPPPTKMQGSATGSNTFTRPVGFGFPKATIEALDGAGKVVASVDLPGTVTETITEPCGGPVPQPLPAGSGTVSSGGAISSGGGTASSGTASSGTASSGTASSGTASTGPATAPASGTTSSQG